jgi:hypothetical protein
MGCGYGAGKDGIGYCRCITPGEDLGVAVIQVMSGARPA